MLPFCSTVETCFKFCDHLLPAEFCECKVQSKESEAPSNPNSTINSHVCEGVVTTVLASWHTLSAPTFERLNMQEVSQSNATTFYWYTVICITT